ncbi:alpha/beta hydrolase [Amorphoplanes nipponensis]|uniref:Alpha/beta hydrolase n=1 Tax=Actinoplanes nipponensis TaxID=135950 RepID=A0A919JPA5_9ACTN|nr:alpha/beta hydrolase [Actinoplanes nipponensis]GIE52975.1 alpha/beta hydrolase [Actinoplanes nipponensis]
MPTITSADGARLEVTSTGSGPGLVVVPGGLRRSHRCRRLAESLGDSRTVHVIERHGPGDSGPPPAGSSIEREVEDALAVLDATGSAELFGHGYGGLAALHVALRRDLRRLVIHEPAAGLDGAPDPASRPGLERGGPHGRTATAMATFLTGLGFAPVGVVPMPALTAFAWFLLRTPDGRQTRQLQPTAAPEVRAAVGPDPDGHRYAAVTSPTLIIAGGRDPEWQHRMQPRLAALIPHARYALVPEPDHHAPGGSAPAAVADLVRAFLTTDDATAR